MRTLIFRPVVLCLLLVAHGGCDDAAPASPCVADDGRCGPGCGNDTDADCPIDLRPECMGIAAAPATDEPFALAFSRAHAGVRFFGPHAATRESDLALVATLGAEGALDREDVVAYASRLDGVCAVTSSTATLAPAEVRVEAGVAWIRPGTGALAIPSGISGAVIDLRGLPASDELEEALARAVAPLVSTPLGTATRRVRVHRGLTDEYFTPESAYSHWIEDRITALSIAPEGSTDVPIALLVDGALPPAAAELAYVLRIARHAWLLGAPIHAQTAEAALTAIGDVGISYRSADLLIDDRRVPDQLLADGPADDPVGFLGEQAGTPPEITDWASARTLLDLRSGDFRDLRPATLGRGELRAAALIAHGMARRFFPYFEVVGEGIDDRLLEVLGTIDETAAGAIDRTFAYRLLRRLGAALEDGHNWVADQIGDLEVHGALALALESIAGEPVVRRSQVFGINPGDAITTIDGLPAGDVFAVEIARSLGATDGTRFQIAAAEVFTLRAATMTIGLRDPAGATRSVTVGPSSPIAHGKLHYATSLRRSGWLTDLGAPSIYYINLDACCSPTTAELNQALANAAGGIGIILDDRGHPASEGVPEYDPYNLLQRLATDVFTMLRYVVPTHAGPDELAWTVVFDGLFPPVTSPSYAGPVALLVDARSISFAEDIGGMFRIMDRGVVVGRPSAGTTGSVTGLQLPGGFAMMITGMQASWPDGAPFHGTGIVPDVAVELTAAALRDGVDEDVMRAIAVLTPE